MRCSDLLGQERVQFLKPGDDLLCGDGLGQTRLHHHHLYQPEHLGSNYTNRESAPSTRTLAHGYAPLRVNVFNHLFANELHIHHSD